MGCPRHAKISIWEIHIDAAIAKVNIVCPVEDIEKLKPELENDSFRKMRVFVKVDIRLVEVGPAEPLRLLVASLAKGWNGEVALGNRSPEPRSVIR